MGRGRNRGCVAGEATGDRDMLSSKPPSCEEDLTNSVSSSAFRLRPLIVEERWPAIVPKNYQYKAYNVFVGKKTYVMMQERALRRSGNE